MTRKTTSAGLLLNRVTHTYPRITLRFVLVIGALLALVLCLQCVRTYLYTNAVLVPQEAGREAERQAGALSTAARSAGISDPHHLNPVIEHVLESASDRVLWIRVLDPDHHILAQGGQPQGPPRIPADWFQRMEKHESLGTLVDTPQGKALVALLPIRLPRPPRRPEPQPSGHHPAPAVVELAIPLKAVAGVYEGLRQNLIVGMIASIALLAAVVVIGLAMPRYLRGVYLESEMQLARRVQHDLQPQPHAISPAIEFAASAVAADHVGGDFYDVFETASGKIGIVLGDVSGKGVSAALLVSVLQGAIRSSTATLHESACERINGMMCERTACERFATLFWGVFDPATSTLRYVNAGHSAPMLIRRGQNQVERLDAGGPVVGVVPHARYQAGVAQIDSSDVLVLYSDGVNEAANPSEEEFGEDRILRSLLEAPSSTPAELCTRIMSQVAAFSSGGPPPDDRTMMVVRFPQAGAALRRASGNIGLEAIA